MKKNEKVYCKDCKWLEIGRFAQGDQKPKGCTCKHPTNGTTYYTIVTEFNWYMDTSKDIAHSETLPYRKNAQNNCPGFERKQEE